MEVARVMHDADDVNNTGKRDLSALFYCAVWPSLERQGWKKVALSDSSREENLFVPPSIDISEIKKDQDRYTMLGTINRLLERRNDAESVLASRYLAGLRNKTDGSSEDEASHPEIHDKNEDSANDDADSHEKVHARAKPSTISANLKYGEEGKEEYDLDSMSSGAASNMKATERGDFLEDDEELDGQSLGVGKWNKESHLGSNRTAINAEETSSGSKKPLRIRISMSPTKKESDKGDQHNGIDTTEKADTNSANNAADAHRESDGLSTGDDRSDGESNGGATSDVSKESHSENRRLPQMSRSGSSVNLEDDSAQHSTTRSDIAESDKKNASTGSRDERREGRKRLRKDTTKSIDNDSEVYSNNPSHDESKEENLSGKLDEQGAKAEKRRRGRPRKIKGDNLKDCSAKSEDTSDKAKRRKRGRPRKANPEQNMKDDRKISSTNAGDDGDEESNDGSAYVDPEEGRLDMKKRKRKRPSNKSTTKRGRDRPKRGRGAASPPPREATPKKEQSSPIIDISWKDGGKNFPKRVSRVGVKYNATTIEKAGTWKESESDKYMELVWDPKKAEEHDVLDFLEKRNIPHNKREAVMIRLHQIGYDGARFDRENVLDTIASKDGSEWTDEERQRFHSEFFRLRKNFREVAKATGKSVNSCLAYYLGTYKHSDHYRLLKTVSCEERLLRLLESEHETDACAICGDGGNLLICDGCEGEYHMGCMRPALQVVPEGKWECDECVDRAFIAAKDSLVRTSNLFERVDNYGGKVSRDEKHNNQKAIDGIQDGGNSADGKTTDENSGLRLRATSPVVDIVRRLAQTISSAFSEGPIDGSSAVMKDE